MIFETKPTHTIRVRTTDAAGAFYEKSFAIQVLNAPIKVTGLYVRGSGWNSSYLAMLAANNLGSAIGGFRLMDGANQLANSSLVTWQTIDQISVTFDEPGAIDGNALRLLNGNNQDLAFAGGGYTYDAATRTARWTLNNALTAGRFLISLDAAMIRDGASANLDGEWTTSLSTYASSGNGTAGGDLNFQFHYLPGDVSRNGQTNPGDVNLMRSLGTTIPNATNFWMDVTGNNQINPGDVNFVRSLGTLILSTATPTNPPPPRGGSPLTSAIGFNTGAINAPKLTQSELDRLATKAVLAWTSKGLDSESVKRLRSTPIVVTNFGASPYLGMSFTNRIEIDDDAAGWGWLLENHQEDGQAQPRGMDLFTVVLHELGHQLGLADEHAHESVESLMHWELQPGQIKRVPGSQQTETVSSWSRSEVHDQSLLRAMNDLDDIDFLDSLSDIHRRRSMRGKR